MKKLFFATSKRSILAGFFCITGILCFYHSTSAQSGRRLPKQIPTPQPTPVVAKTPIPSEENEPPEKIEYLLIVGEILNWTLDYCSQELENQPNLKLKAEVGGKMNFKEAQDIAKKGNNVHILWIGFALENLGKGKTQVNYAKFTILKPESAKKLFTGQVDSRMLSNNGGVMRSKKPIGEAAKIGNIGEEIIYRLLRWGWLN